MCKAPSVPKPPPIPMPPTALDPDVLMARDRQRAMARRKAGRQGTIFGGALNFLRKYNAGPSAPPTIAGGGA